MTLALWLAVACVPAEVEPPFGGPVPVTRDGSPTPFPLPTETAPAIEPVGSVPPTPYEPPAVPPTPTPVPPFPGMIYQDGPGLWQVAGDWQPELLAELPAGAVLSPDSRQALYLSGDDIWLVELDSREELNLTAGSGRGHCCAQ